VQGSECKVKGKDAVGSCGAQVADADEEGERRTSILGVEAGRPTCKWKGTMRARMALVPENLQAPLLARPLR
jgi:hypothetical protein